MNINPTRLNKKAQTALVKMDAYVDAFMRAKRDGRAPDRIAIDQKDHAAIMASFSNPKPEVIKHRGIRVEIA